jgi:hypothetical protein
MKTAVEWFYDEIKHIIPNDYLKKYEQAKEMEKEQHQETWNVAHQAGRFEGKGIAEENWQTFETYWEESRKS